MSRSRAWCFTLNNYEEPDYAAIALLGAQYTIYGKEIGESGTPHLQGYVYFKTARTLASLKKKLPRAHWEVRKGSHGQASEYCRKDGDVVEYGVPPEKDGGDTISQRMEKNKRLRDTLLSELVDSGELNILDVKRLKQSRDILANEGLPFVADGVRGVWIHGPPGTGKTHYARSEYGETFFVKAQNKWFDGYQGEPVIVLDDLDKFGACLGHYMKIWADKWSCTGEVKGGTVPLRHEKFVVTSNYTPAELWPEDDEMRKAIERRFEMKEMLIKYNNL